MKLGLLGRGQLFDINVSVESFPADVSMGTARTHLFPLYHGLPKVPLEVFLRNYESAQDAVIEFNFDTSVLQRLVVEGITERMIAMTDAVLSDPDCVLGRVPLLTTGERQRVLEELNATAVPYPRDKLLHELFEEQVERAPGAAAVICGDKQLTYEQLNRRANQLAHYLIKRGVGPLLLRGSAGTCRALSCADFQQLGAEQMSYRPVAVRARLSFGKIVFAVS